MLAVAAKVCSLSTFVVDVYSKEPLNKCENITFGDLTKEDSLTIIVNDMVRICFSAVFAIFSSACQLVILDT